MELSRREFLKVSGEGMGGIFLLRAIDPKVALAKTKLLPLKKKIGEKSTICPYDASGCGFVVATEKINGKSKVVNIEGDPDHPINRGAACAKGATLRQTSADNPWRLSKVLYRRPGGTDWEEKSWEWALNRIASNIKQTRDTYWTENDEQGYRVNRTDAIANVGGSALDNEECYLLAKMARAIGVVYLEHHARI